MADQELLEELETTEEEEVETEPQVEEPEVETEVEPEQPEDPGLERARRLYDYLQNNPDMAQAFVQVEQGQAAVVPRDYVQQQHEQQEEEETPDFWVDPEAAVRTLYDRIGEQQRYIEQQNQVQATSAVTSGIQAFSQAHPELSQQEVMGLANTLGNRGILPHYWERNPSHSGVAQALEETYRIEYFGRSKDKAASDIVKSNKQKRKAAAVGGSSRTAPRTEPAPKTSEERREAMVNELKDWVNSNR